MASSAPRGRKTSSGRTSSGRGKTTRTGNGRQAASYQQEDSAIRGEIVLICVFALTLLLFLCNFGIIGVIGDAVSSVMFGLFGKVAYAVPIAAFVAIAFGISNQGNRTALRKLVFGILFFFLIGVVFELIEKGGQLSETYSVADLYTASASGRSGGGVFSGSLAWLMYHFLGMVGTILLLLVLSVICMVVITERSFVGRVKSSGRYVYETARSDAQVRRERSERRREENQARREQQRERRLELEQRRREEREQKEAEQILRMDKKVSGVMKDTSLKAGAEKKKARDDMHEITLEQAGKETVEVRTVAPVGEPEFDYAGIRVTTMQDVLPSEDIPKEGKEEIPADIEAYPDTPVASREQILARQSDVYADMKEMHLPPLQTEKKAAEEKREEPVRRPQEEAAAQGVRPKAVMPKQAAEGRTGQTAAMQPVQRTEKEAPKPEKPYRFPPISLLHKTESGGKGDSAEQLKETARHLQETLQTFGVRVTITDISQGPTVTRYELQPEQGVRVSKILSLADDIKLNLAATDVRIEAPILGKSAVGIEVPNRTTMAVGFRDLVESREFQEFPSKISFAVGKDIAGKVVVSDIAKMPHMLIAGSTGSGKSVCINTLIMSILYKANPSEVKLILVDPKVVELSVYNGIPHLLIPVVTDPKKASAALQWGVAEMTDRYKKFADYNVRDLKGFNKKIEELEQKGETDLPGKMPQIVIIVDELADLMMVAPGEVEESICRLAQLARAAGIHLIIATQRPSVDVITGLIKANMPSRVAFAVSSGVDSRTILDMNGAEKLLGKGDMLFYPQGYSKPVRLQGAFVSDEEVSAVVEFLKNQKLGNTYSDDIEEKLSSMGAAGGSASGGAEYDEHFVEAGKFIIDKDKASIGMLQRVFKIGFNRAARIMDQLAQAGVVGEEEGTKPRKVLMTMEEFEQIVEEII